MLYLDQFLGAEKALLHSPFGFRAWLAAFAKIKGKDGRLTPIRINVLQERFVNAVEWFLVNELPIRIIILKPRQKGCSTISVGLNYWLMCVRTTECLIAGGKKKQTLNLWKILKRYAQYDQAPWGLGEPFLGAEVRMSNGSIAQADTAGDEELGRSGTFQSLLATEAARWSEYGVAAAKEVLTGAMACVPDLPWTSVILESTSGGPAGTYYETWGEGQTLEEVLRDGYHGGFVKIFAGVHEFPDSYHRLTAAQREAFADSLTPKERLVQRKVEEAIKSLGIGHPMEYMSMRRVLRKRDCFGEDKIYQREYPHDATEAFVAGSLNVFSLEGMERLQTAMRLRARKRQSLLFESAEPDNPHCRQYGWRPADDGEAKWWVWELPMVGRSYVMAVDFMEFLSLDERGDKLDEHCIQIWRGGYHDASGVWRPPAEIARTVTPCRWDADILEDEIVAGAMLYGNCKVLPENNKDGGIIRNLVRRGVNVYEQRRGIDVGQETRKAVPTGKYGFRTTGGEGEGTRKMILNSLIAAVRESGEDGHGIEVSERTYQEMTTFVRNAKGKAEALQGERDDSVITAAIAYYGLQFATNYKKPTASIATDPFLREALLGAGKRRGGRRRAPGV